MARFLAACRFLLLIPALAGAAPEYVHLNRRISDEVLLSVNNITDPVVFAYTVASHLQLKVAAKHPAEVWDVVQEEMRQRPAAAQI